MRDDRGWTKFLTQSHNEAEKIRLACQGEVADEDWSLRAKRGNLQSI
ncbi:MAG: hypothetical protein JXA96_07225 [Sedimentisphaerales bacterium]|nr:hypothetical protein [Sedimentisphaerales bacterium]